MSQTHTTAGLAALALAAAMTPLVGAPHPAAAVEIGDAEVAVYLAASRGSEDVGIYRRATAGGAPVLLVAPARGVSRFDLAVSQDGSRYAYAEVVYTADAKAVRERVVVRDVNGPFKRRVLDRPYADTAGVGDVSLSPDGRSVAWTQAALPANGDDPTYALWRSSVFGSPVVVPGSTGLVEPVFATSRTLLALDVRGRVSTLRSIPLTGGATRTVSNALGTASDLRLSPDGDRVVYQDYDPRSEDVATRVASITASGGPIAVDTAHATTVAAGSSDYSVGWRRDGSSLAFTRSAGDAPGDLWSLPVAGPALAAPLAVTPQDEVEVVIARIDAQRPGAVGSTEPAVLAGTTATFPLDVRPTASDWSGTYYRRTTGSTTVTRLAPVGVRVVDAGLTIGRTYSFAFAAVDSSGNLGPWSAPRLVTATEQPRFGTSDPTSSSSQRASFPVLLSVANAATTRYDVLSGRNGGAYSPWIARQAGGVQVFGRGARPGFAPTVSRPGDTYRFSGVAFDTHGNRTASIGTRRHAVVPFDDTALTTSGATAVVARPFAYGLSTLWLLTRGSRASMHLTGDRLQVIGERGPTVGRFDVLVDGVRIATVDPVGPERRERQVLLTRSLVAGSHTVVIRARGTRGRPTVVLDAIAARRLG